MSTLDNKSNTISRRAALRRLGIAAGMAYVVPSVLMVSQARAGDKNGSSPSKPANDRVEGGPSKPADASSVTPPTPPTAPSNVDDIEADVLETDTCQGGAHPVDTALISARDFERAQQAVEAGYAKPLDAIWNDFTAEYSGNVISIEFTGYRWRPRFRFKAISPSGHLETVIVSARTGKIEKIIGC